MLVPWDLKAGGRWKGNHRWEDGNGKESWGQRGKQPTMHENVIMKPVTLHTNTKLMKTKIKCINQTFLTLRMC